MKIEQQHWLAIAPRQGQQRVMEGGGAGSPYLVGLIPGFIGLAMLAYAMFLAAPVE
jgi:hypothetical protein